MRYCSHCGTEYLDDVQACSHCADSVLREEPPARKAWIGESAGWYVVVGAERREDLEAPSNLLADSRIPHMILVRREDESYVPEGAGPEATVPPLLYEDWGDALLLVTPRPLHGGAVSLVKSLQPPRAEGEEPSEAEPTSREMASPSYRLPWDRRPPPLSPQRKALGVLLAGMVGFGCGLLAVRRYKPLLLVLPLQLVILAPLLPEVGPEPGFAFVHVAGRFLEFLLAIQTFLRQDRHGTWPT